MCVNTVEEPAHEERARPAHDGKDERKFDISQERNAHVKKRVDQKLRH